MGSWQAWTVDASEDKVDARTVDHVVVEATWETEGTGKRVVEVRVGRDCAVFTLQQAIEFLNVFSLATGQCNNTCGHGHEWTVENTRIGPAGRRQCRQCAKARALARGA